jgi:transcriptional regulator with XRE-family HTH domain
MDEQQVFTTEEADVRHDDLWGPMRLGGIIAGARKGNGITRQEDLVIEVKRATGYSMSTSTLGGIESGERLPSLNALLALMLTLELRFEDLSPSVTVPLREAYRKLTR